MLIKTLEDAKKFAATAEVGSAWSFDGWPQPPTTDEEFEAFDSADAEARALLVQITEVIESAVAPPSPEDERMQQYRDTYTNGQLKKLLKAAGVKGYSGLKEDKLIKLALDNGIKL